MSFRAYLSSSYRSLLTVATAVFVVFLPAIIVPYGFSDDYSILWMAASGEPSPQFGRNVVEANAIGGRPFMGLLDRLFFTAAGTIDNLRFLRLAAVLGIVALALLLHWALVRSRIRPVPAALIAILVCTLPSFQVYGSWAVLFAEPFGALLGGAASVLAVVAADARRDLVADRLVGATAMLLAALLIYQPAAMFFWVFLAVALVGAMHAPGRVVHLIQLHFAIGAVALGLWYLILKLSVHVIGKNVVNADRATLTHDIGGKARWFFEQPLYRSLNLFDLTPSLWFAILVAAVATGGIVLWLLARTSFVVPSVATALVLVPLCYLPNLAVRESWAAYRTQVALSSLIALYACFGLLGLWTTFRDRLRRRISGHFLKATERALIGGSVAFVAASVFFAAKNVMTLIAEPQMTELRLLRSQMLGLPTGAPRLAFVETDWYGGMTKLVVYDEFGLPSSVRPWALGPAVDLILREEGRLTPDQTPPGVDIFSPYTTIFPANEPVIDLRGLRQLR